ncbi:MAG: alpha/beta fold hydrolase [Phycisphaerales bacterium]
MSSVHTSHNLHAEGPGALEGAEVTRWPISAEAGAICGTVVETGRGVVCESPVVFLHGLVGLNDHWEPSVSKVRDRLRCVLFELPLLNLSGDDCSIEGVTRLTERFLVERVGRPAIIVGNSFGGHVALRVALQRPELVRGLVLAGSSGIIEKTLVSDLQLRPTRVWLRRKIAELFFDEANMSEADVDRAFSALSQRGGARAMVRLSRSARRDELRDRVGQIRVPTLIVWGRQDVVTPPEAAEGFATLIKGSRLEWFDRCGHVPMIEKHEEFARLLVEFAAGLPPESREDGRGGAAVNGARGR